MKRSIKRFAIETETDTCLILLTKQENSHTIFKAKLFIFSYKTSGFGKLYREATGHKKGHKTGLQSKYFTSSKNLSCKFVHTCCCRKKTINSVSGFKI
jgi:hypothetical protein